MHKNPLSLNANIALIFGFEDYEKRDTFLC
jgi:hypothetical protein